MRKIRVLLQSFFTHRDMGRLWSIFMKPLINSVIRYTPKRRSLVEDLVFVCIWHEVFLSLLSYVRHDEDFEILRNERNGASRVDDLAQ